MTNHFRIQFGTWEQLSKEAQSVRMAVFVNEQCVPIELEMDEMDAQCLHVVIFDDLKAVATARLLPDASIGRMAVLAEYRGQGLGAMLLQSLMDKAQQLGHTVLRLSAQLHAIGFYERFGFVVYGESYIDAGIVHRAMRYSSI